MDFEGNYFIATTHVGKLLKKINDVRLDLEKEDKYINTGVMLMNLEMWNEKYIGKLNLFYEKTVNRMQKQEKKEGIRNGKQTI